MNSPPTLIELLEHDLMSRYQSPLIGGDDLRRVLGYSSQEALRQAVARGTVPVALLDVPHRRGKYALTRDIATWLAELRSQAAKDT